MSNSARKRKHDPETATGKPELIVPRYRSKKKPEAELQAEGEYLSKILFGGASSFLKSLEEAEKEPIPTSSNVDSGVGNTDSEDTEPEDEKPAWFDDDDGIEIEEPGKTSNKKVQRKALKHKFVSIVGNPSWAALNKEKEEIDSDDEVLQSVGFIKKTAKLHLPAQHLECKSVLDVNSECYSEGPIINAVEFHPTSSVALVAGNSGIASLYTVDGKKNNKLHSIAFPKYSIECAKFTKDGNEAILGSFHNYIFSYDLLSAKGIKINLPQGVTSSKRFIMSPDGKYIVITGKWGEIHVLSSLTKEKLFTLKQDTCTKALAFNPQGSLLFGLSVTGEGAVWDMNTRKLKHKWTDEGCIQGAAIDVSPSNQFIATGSMQGVVNLYNYEDVLQNKNPAPKKSIFNLTTAIEEVKFNSSSEILSLHSSETMNAIKLFHIGSSTVFNNFPGPDVRIGRLRVANFSPGSGYLALGNSKSKVLLYRLKHFKSY